jgi:hypothetical protein
MSEAMGLIAELAIRDGMSNLPSKVASCWERVIDDDWTVAVNPHPTPRDYRGSAIQPYHCHVYWRDWPAGILTPFEGVMAAHPDAEGANEAHLIRSLRTALGKDGAP